ncbi:2-C-methyl-D-erythritol 4-phosphate cytidylyltransferase [Limnohabitans sp.]
MTDRTPSTRFHALIPCAGMGSRAGTVQPKQYQQVAGQPMVMHTVQALAQVPQLASGWVILSPDDGHVWAEQGWPTHFQRVACGGATRAQSVFNGLQAMLAAGLDPQDWVLVHDAARCLVSPESVSRLIETCQGDAVGGLLALPLPDTLKSEEGGRVLATVSREHKWLAQTPQMFRLQALHDALAAVAASGFADITDEASAMERLGLKPRLVEGTAQNFKVTYPADFALAEAILGSRA